MEASRIAEKTFAVSYIGTLRALQNTDWDCQSTFSRMALMDLVPTITLMLVAVLTDD